MRVREREISQRQWGNNECEEGRRLQRGNCWVIRRGRYKPQFPFLPPILNESSTGYRGHFEGGLHETRAHWSTQEVQRETRHDACLSLNTRRVSLPVTHNVWFRKVEDFRRLGDFFWSLKESEDLMTPPRRPFKNYAYNVALIITLKARFFYASAFCLDAQP